LIARARQREKAGDTEGAARLFGSWLEVNPGASGSARIFGEYFQLEQDFPALMDTSLRFLDTGRGRAGAGEQFARIARLLELAGRIELARDTWFSAYGEAGADAALLAAFLLSVQMNDADFIARNLPQIKERGNAAQSLIDAIAALKAGEEAAAVSALDAVANSRADDDLSLKALWILYAVAHAKGDERGQADARARLEARFPASPETIILSNGSSNASQAARPTVVLSPTPDAFGRSGNEEQAVADSAPSSPPAAALSAAQAAAASPATAGGKISVQAGSFQMKENADDLAAELAKKGFVPIVQKEMIQGKGHFRVFAATGLDTDPARALLLRLRELGFSGFLVKEK
jgi:cell division protein FtsN